MPKTEPKTEPKSDIAGLLREHGIEPSAQRMAIAGYVLRTKKHPTADQVLRSVRRTFPYVSRATVYNTLNLLTRKGLLRCYNMSENGGVFDPVTARHHHLMDEKTGEIHDIRWEDLGVTGLDSLSDFEVTDYMVVVRGRKKRKSGRSAARGRQETIGDHHRRKEEEES